MAYWAAPETIAAAQSGDEKARESLVTAIWPVCYRLAASVLGDAALAQDVAQEACAIVHRRIPGLRDRGAFGAWVYRIVMHEAVRARRRNPPSFEPPERASIPDDGTAAIDVWRALRDLPPEQRDVVVLFYFDDLSTEEIAKILGARTPRCELVCGERESACVGSSTTIDSSQQRNARRDSMHSDFSTTAKFARAAIPVPSVPLGSITNRSRALGNRDRLRAVVACGAMALAAIGAAAAGSKIVPGIQFWLSGGRGALVVHSMAVISPPLGNDLRAIAAKATFPVVYPVGLPAGTRIIRIFYAPSDHPTSITLQYLRPGGALDILTLVDPTIVNAGRLPMPGDAGAPRYGTVDQWRAGGETVVVFKGNMAPPHQQAVEDAMQATSPSASLSANEAMLWRLGSVGAPYELADIAERLAPNGYVIGRGELRLVPGLVRTGGPVTMERVTYFTKIPYVDGIPQYNKATLRSNREIAVSADGVRAIWAVMGAAGESGRWTDCCEILYTPASNGWYTIWTLPMSPSSHAKKYLVDAKTYQVRAGIAEK